MGEQILGTCSICGGAVTVPSHWGGMRPPIPTCMRCGATKKQPLGRVIEMEPGPHQRTGPIRGDGGDTWNR